MSFRACKSRRRPLKIVRECEIYRYFSIVGPSRVQPATANPLNYFYKLIQ